MLDGTEREGRGRSEGIVRGRKRSYVRWKRERGGRGRREGIVRGRNRSYIRKDVCEREWETESKTG